MKRLRLGGAESQPSYGCGADEERLALLFKDAHQSLWLP